MTAKQSKPKVNGRPTIYTQELAERICNLIATTPIGLERLCNAHDWMPDHQTVKNWRASNPSFFALYLQAKEAQGHTILDKVWNDADDLPADTAEINRFNAIFRFQQFQLAKLSSKHFGDKPAEQAAVFTDTEKTELKNMMADFAAKHDKDY
jgi:hypothetical protein